LPTDGFEFRPIVPTRNPFAAFGSVRSKLAEELRDFAAEAQNELSSYPPSRSSYRRTGRLGRSWTTDGPKMEGGDLLARVGNNVEYAPTVQGKADQQRQLFRTYGWKGVTEVAGSKWPRHQDALRRILREGH